ncbi:ABC transporter substrate-binding protein [Pseudomonas sp. GOM7]|uniref:extracellular solute-binding protein n=1 Tax=unclassified Pseudomonas TaxID=196821 RepID=UPI00227AC8F7|nr:MULTISPECIES: ABC transporter substrate-binding protein [unclassified Pseudomonas]WAJ39755.1 ABC transporter substrate-binding protein [Pseudomonas sp. GOM7]
MTNPLRSFLLHGSSLILLGLSGLTFAAAQHAVTLYDEPPKYPANFQHFDYTNPDAPKGGTLREAGFGGFDSLNPFISKGVPADDIGLIYDTLTVQSLDEPFTAYGLVAESIEKAPDNAWVRFHLRKAARFHDGMPITAEDVKFTFDTLMSKGSPMYRGYYAGVERVEVESPHSVRFIFKHTGNRELPLILGQLPVLPEHWWNELDNSQSEQAPRLGDEALQAKLETTEDNRSILLSLPQDARLNDKQPLSLELLRRNLQFASQGEAALAAIAKVSEDAPQTLRLELRQPADDNLLEALRQLPLLPPKRDFSKSNLDAPLGSGPYRVGEVRAGRSIRYERVKDWWAKDLPVSRGFYNFDAIQFDYYRDNTVALEALKAGQFDYWLEMSAKNWATAYSTPAVANGQLIKEEILNRNPTGMQGFIFNTRRALFQDRRVREALSLLFDFEWANKRLFNGAYTRTRSYFDNSELGSSGLPSEAELAILEPLRGKIPAEVFSEEFRVPQTDGSGIIREQQRRAYQLLQQAGWRIDGDRMLDAQGKPVSFEFLLAQAEFERVLLPFKRNLADLGIDMVIRRVDVSQYINRLRSRDFDMIVGGFAQSNSPGNEQREYWHSSSADNPGSRNFIGLKDPAIDKLVEELINADSRQDLINHTRALDRVLLWGHYVIPNWHIKTWRVAYWNRFEHPKVTPLYDIGLHTWWERTDLPAADAEAAQ